MLRSALVLVVSVAFAVSVEAADEAWPTPDWETAEPADVGVDAERLEQVGKLLKQSGAKTGLVVRRGKIVGEWYFGDARRDSKYLVYSTSKSFASTAAGLMIAEGRLALDTKVGDVLPDVKPADKKNVTLRQILSMSTGVHNDPGLSNRPKRFSYALYEAPMDHEPGAKWDYNNTGLALLAPLLQKQTGKQVDEILHEKVFTQIGIGESDWSWDSSEDYRLPYSGLHITARGLARFGLLFLREGKWRGEQIVPAAWVKEATGPSQEMNPEYGYLWWNNTTGRKWPGVPKDAYAALGKFGNNLLIVPSLDLIVIRQIGEDDQPDRKVDMTAIYAAACAACK